MNIKLELLKLLERRVFNAEELVEEIDKLYKQDQALQLQQNGVSGQSEQLVCGCGSDDIYIEPKVYNCQDCGKSWK